MIFIDYVLQQPSYGWMNGEGELVKPTNKQLLKEAFSRIDIFSNRKNWISFLSVVMILCVFPFFYLFLFNYFSWLLLLVFVD